MGLAAAPAGTGTAAMPGVSLEGLAQAGVAELAELRQELGAFRGMVEGQLEQALQRVQPLAQALQALEEEHLELRAELARLSRHLNLLVLRLGPQEPLAGAGTTGEDLSTLFLEAQDPCAHFEGTEEPSSPVAHPPAFSSMRQQSSLQLSRSNSGVSVGSPAPRQRLAWGGGRVALALEAPSSPRGVRSQTKDHGMRWLWCTGDSVTGICQHLSSLLRGENHTCLLRIAGVPGGLWAAVLPVPAPSGAQAQVGAPALVDSVTSWARAVGCRMGPGVWQGCSVPPAPPLLPPSPILGLARCPSYIAGGSC